MTRPTTDQIVAHTDLLRSVDRLLAQADEVREKPKPFFGSFLAANASTAAQGRTGRRIRPFRGQSHDRRRLRCLNPSVWNRRPKCSTTMRSR